MNNFYIHDTYYKRQEEKTNILKGKDFIIQYIGDHSNYLEIDVFELNIYENGKDAEQVSYYQKVSTTKPTCTSKGYTTYECSVCGHRKKDDYIDKLGHSFTNVDHDGTKTAKCDRCDVIDTITDTGSQLIVDSISIKSLPNKLEYVEGQELDLTGLTVEATYTNGKTEEISNYEVTGYNKDSLGTQWITVSYYGKSTSFTSCNSSTFIELICPTPNTFSPTVNCLKSWKQISSGVLPFKLLPALNISIAISSSSIPAIFASSVAIALSTAVQVGERNNNVSEIIAQHNNPAIVGGTATPDS